MRLQTFALIVVCIAAIIALGMWFFGMLQAGPFGWLFLIPLAVGLVLLGGVIVGRVRSKEDSHYDNIDK